jgi:hypothetical protein
MKKLILITFALFIGVLGYSQQVDHNFKNATDIALYTMDGDTTYTFKTTNQYFFDFQFTWAALDQTDGSVKIQISEDGTNYVDYPNTDTLLLNTASGSAIIRDTFKGTASRYLRIRCSSGTLKTTGNLATKP